MVRIAFTRLTRAGGKALTKHYQLAADDSLRRTVRAQLYDGTAQRVAVPPSEFPRVLESLTHDQALSYGTTGVDSANVTTKEKWEQAGRPSNLVTRTRAHFQWPTKAGVFMLDHDPTDSQRLTKDELLAALHSAVPGLRGVAHCYWVSSSSHITNTKTGEDLTGLRGQRVYLFVADATDTPRAMEVLQARLWLAGLGHIFLTKAGGMIPRTIIDGVTAQPERLDFAAGAQCDAPLTQQRGAPQYRDGPLLDTKTALPDLSQKEQSDVERLQERAKQDIEGDARRVRAEYVDRRAAEMVGDKAQDPAVMRALRETLQRACETRVLAGDFQIHVYKDGGFEPTTVGAILDNPGDYHGLTTQDPLEPDYGGGRRVAKLYLFGGRPNLYSQAHGGENYRLIRQPARIQATPGNSAETVRRTLDLLRQLPDFYDMGGQLCVINEGNSYALDRHSLTFQIGSVAQFFVQRRTPKGELYEVDVDPPRPVIEQILSLGARRGLKQLDAVITAPILRTDGSLLTRPGYDLRSKLFLDLTEAAPLIPESPTRRQVQEALDELMHPFRDFAFCSPLDRSTHLQALLTACLRAVLPTAPATGYDAAMQGSGKTLLASCVAALGSGGPPSMTSPPSRPEEMQKTLLSVLLGGSRHLIFDNLLGLFDSAELALFLTSDRYSGRVLGASTTATQPNRCHVLLTGNNLSLTGDMPRRVLVCRIDPATERPYARQFELDPLQHTLANRPQMVTAALTIIRGWLSISDFSETAPGKMASFEVWDALVRQPIAWIARELQPDLYEDPMRAVDSIQTADPEKEELRELLEVLHEITGGRKFSVKDVVGGVLDFSPESPRERLREILNEIKPGAGESTRSTGRILKYRVGRIVGGYRLVLAGRTKVQQFTVEHLPREKKPLGVESAV